MIRSLRVERELQAVAGKYSDTRLVDEAGGSLLLVIPRYPIPAGFDRSAARIAVRIGALYPAEKLDLFWVDPALSRSDGAGLPNVMGAMSLAEDAWTQISWHDNAPHDPARATILGFIRGIGGWFTQQVGGR